MDDAKKAVHNPVHDPVQNAAEHSGTEPQESKIEDDVNPCVYKTIRQKNNGV